MSSRTNSHSQNVIRSGWSGCDDICKLNTGRGLEDEAFGRALRPKEVGTRLSAAGAWLVGSVLGDELLPLATARADNGHTTTLCAVLPVGSRVSPGRGAP